MITRCLVYPGLGLGRDWLTSRQLYKVEHIRVNIYLVLQSIYYRRPAGEKYSDGSPSNTALNGNIPISPTGNPPNTVTQISRSRVRGCPQQPPYSLLGECGNNAPLITSQGFNAKTPNPKIHDILQIQYGSVQRP